MKKLFPIIALLFFFGCYNQELKNLPSENPIVKAELENNEIDVIRHTIRELCQPPASITPSMSKKLQSHEEIIKFQYAPRYKKSFLDDTIVSNLYLYDTLFVAQKEFVEQEYVFNKIHDSVFYELATILVKDTLNPKKIDLSKIGDLKPFELLDAIPENWRFDYRVNFYGIASYSRIVFNKKQDKVAFVFDFICGGLCGSGKLVFCEKIDDYWEIVDVVELWIA